MNHNMKKEDILALIVDVLEQKVSVDYIKLHSESKQSALGFQNSSSEGKVLRDFLVDSNSLQFEVLPFPLKELEKNFALKVQHYLPDNSQGELLLRLVPKEANVWQLIKQLFTEHFKAVDGTSSPKMYQAYLINKYNYIIQRLVNHPEPLAKIVEEATTKHCLIRISAVSQEFVTAMEEKSISRVVALCFSVD
mmetsp:Transcript_20124/g.14854  ORF Transcript_20124/g.14854 Transcript_20124/m.14854 type:complete len:193 (+) Transcript_20124:205-783(+)